MTYEGNVYEYENSTAITWIDYILKYIKPKVITISNNL